MQITTQNTAGASDATKVCARCKVEKLTSEFTKRTKSPDGLQAYCKVCSKTYLSKWQDEHREHYNEFMKNRYKNNEEHRIAQLNRQRVHQALKHNKPARSTLSLLGAPISLVNLWLEFTRNYTSRSPLMHIDQLDESKAYPR